MYVLGLMESFKGCPFMCSFCAAKGKIRERDIDKCLKEIEYLYNLGIYRFYFMDLTFGVNRFKTEELLQKLSKFKEINPNPGGSIKHFCDPVKITSIPHASG